MRYRIVFANNLVGQSQMPPVELEIADSGVADRTSDISRHLRNRVVDALTAAPAPGAELAAPVIAAHVNVAVMLGAGEGAVYYGVTTFGRFSIIPIT